MDLMHLISVYERAITSFLLIVDGDGNVGDGDEGGDVVVVGDDDNECDG